MARYDNKIHRKESKISMLEAINIIDDIEGNPPEVTIIFDSIVKTKISNFDYKLCFDSLCSGCGSISKNEFHFGSKMDLNSNLDKFLIFNASIMSCSP